MNPLFFYYCHKFEKEITRKGYEKKVRNKLQEISQRKELQSGRDSISVFKELFVLKTGGEARTLVQRVVFEEENKKVIYFVRDVIDHEDWVKTVSSQVKSGQWVMNYPLSEEEKQAGLQSYIEQILKKEKNKATPPPQEMVAWFQDFKLKLGLEIYETESWVRYATNNTEGEGLREKDLSNFQDLIHHIVSDNTYQRELLIEDQNNQLWIAKNERVGIVFTFTEELGKKYYLIYNGASLINQFDYWTQIQEDFRNNKHQNLPTTLEDIQRLALRAYPSYTLKPQQSELWDKIQKSSENSNYSLLKEQIEFLENFRFPSYINGQAGSGKSTMLYYIFANIYLLKQLGAIKGNIIFLTENEQLLQNTKTAIKDLLLNNPEFGLNFQTDFEDFDAYFASFKHFLLGLMPEDDRAKFPSDKYLDFSLFKKLYDESNIPQNIKKKYSAEESWFAITTYIKGYNADCIITSSNYETEVNQKSRILSREKIAGVEQYVFPFYNKLIEEKGYWDRLKIIRYIQENISINKNFEVVICDEAQDFCRVELRFILRLCELLQYDLSDTEQVPILFAGDPNQTVNPTGFRIGEMKDIIYEELKQIANFEKLEFKGEVIYNPKHNYRSSQAVVNLANYIQYYRKKILGIHIENPQIAKQSEAWHNQANQNVFLAEDAVLNNQNLIERLQYKAFIIPSEQQEKKDYVGLQSLFTEKIKDADTKTAIESKGAEYKQVVLYGFGKSYLEKFGELLLDKTPNNDDFEERYFFNKLYVGITRAKDELIIIDSEQAQTDFWKKILSIQISDENWQVITSHDDLMLYDTDSILESSPETALDNAKKDKEQGLNNQNPNQLRVAAKQFFRLNETNGQNECLAFAEKLQGNWKEAAQYFAKTKDGLEQSADCYWEGKLLREMLINLTSLRTPAHIIRSILAKIAIDEGNTPSANELNDLYQYKHLIRKLTENITWRDELIEKLPKVAQAIENKDQIRRFSEILLEIAMSTDTQLYESIGQLFYKIDELEWAIKAWDNIDNFEEQQVYINTKIKQARLRFDTNDEIIWLDKLLGHQSESEKMQTRQKLVQLYDSASEKIEGEYALLAIYRTMFFVQVAEDKLLSIAQKTENKLSNKPALLKDFYADLLNQSDIINALPWNFILERWAKYSLHLSISIEEINQQYKKWVELQSKIFQPFSEKEIQGIENIPQIITRKPSQHFQNIRIENFRKFKEIELQNLGQFNLIVGDNNTGKTSLLEALTFTPDEAEFAQRLALCYAERANDFDLDKLEEDFWKEFVFRSSERQNLKFELNQGRSIIQYQFPNKEEIQLKTLRNLTKKDAIKNPLIPFGKGFDKYLAQSYSENIDGNKLVRKNFVENLSIFIPNVEDIRVKVETILVEETQFNEGVPISQYGEGANKLFRILLQMTLNKGGRIMIDEIDAGIHFSRFKRFWKILIRLAQQNDIQLFATTHNLECIQYFSEALEELSTQETHLKETVRTITLYQTQEGKIKARTRSFEAFSEAIEEGYNIRGGE